MFLLRLFVFAVLMLDGHSRIRVQRVRCSIIELNHRHENGRLCYSQVILWEWNEISHRHDVVSWWLVEPSKIDTLPFTKTNGDCVARFPGVEAIEAIGHAFVETETNYDPETENKKLRPEVSRRKVR